MKRKGTPKKRLATMVLTVLMLLTSTPLTGAVVMAQEASIPETSTSQSSAVESSGEQTTPVASETTTGETENAVTTPAVEQAPAMMPMAAEAPTANTVIGTWTSLNPAATHLSDATDGDIWQYAISYTVNLSGTSDKKVVVIQLPTQLSFASAKPMSDGSNGIIDNETTMVNTTATQGGKLTVTYDQMKGGQESFTVAVNIKPNIVSSNMLLAIENSLSSGGVTNFSQTTMTIKNYLDRKATLSPLPDPSTAPIYSGIKTPFILRTTGLDDYSIDTKGFQLNSAVITLNIEDYVSVKLPGETIFRSIRSDEISFENSSTCTYDSTTMKLVLLNSRIQYLGPVPFRFNVTYNLPAGTVIQFNAANPDSEDAKGVAYENNLDSVFINFYFNSASFTLKELTPQIDISIFNPRSNPNASTLPYIFPHTQQEPLFRVGFSTYALQYDNLNFSVSIPANTTITDIYMPSTVTAVLADGDGTFFTISDETGNIRQKIKAGVNHLETPISDTDKIILNFSTAVQNKTMAAGDSTWGADLTFFGEIEDESGKVINFDLDTASIKGDYSLDGVVWIEQGSITDVQSGNNKIQTTLSDKKYYDAEIYTGNQLLNENKTTKSDNAIQPGKTYYWGHSIYPSNLSYMSNYREFHDPIFYFSVPKEFIPANGVSFSIEDIYATLSIKGATAQPYDTSLLIFEELPCLPGSNLMGGDKIIKVSAPDLDLMYDYQNLNNWPNNKVDRFNIYLKVKVEPTIIRGYDLVMTNTAILTGTSYERAIDVGQGYYNGRVFYKDTIKDPAFSGDRHLLTAPGKTLTLAPLSQAAMFVTIKSEGASSFTYYNPSIPLTASQMKAGTFGDFKLTLVNSTTNDIANAKGYFVLPHSNGWNSYLIAGLSPTADSATDGISLYYSTDENLDGSLLPTNDNANWSILTESVDYNTITAVKVVANNLRSGTFYEAIIPFNVSATNYKTASYSIGEGNTSYDYANIGLIVPQDKTAAIDLVQSQAPIVEPVDLGYTDDLLAIEYGSNVSTINAKIFEATVTDDVTGTTLTRDGRIMGLDLQHSTISFNGGLAVSFADAGIAPINSNVSGTYTLTYVSLPDHDNQVTTVTKEIVVGNPPEFTYTIEYYLDDVSGEPSYVEVGGAHPENNVLTSSLISADFLEKGLSADWLNLHRPDGYQNGEVQGQYPTITADEAANVVKVVYRQIPEPTPEPTETTLPTETTTEPTETTVEPTETTTPTETTVEPTETTVAPTEPSTSVLEAKRFTKLPDKVKVNHGDLVNYTLSGIGNPYASVVTDFRIGDIVPEGIEFTTGKIPAFTQGSGLTYNIVYKNQDGIEKTIAKNVDANAAYSFNAPTLAAGESIKELILVFGQVPVDFGKDNSLVYTFKVTATTPGTIITNKAYLSFVLDQKPIYIENTGNSSISLNGLTKTGESQTLAPWLAAFCLVLGGAGLMMLKRRTKKSQHN